MRVELNYNSQTYYCLLNEGIDISIPLKEGHDNPNCYYAEEVKFETIRSGDFIGSVTEGGNVNYKKITLTPHGNATHTEVYGHIHADKNATISELHKNYHAIAALVTLEPTKMENGDLVITIENFLARNKYHADAIIIRTLPNEKEKIARKYSGANPPYIDAAIAEYAYKNNISHLLIDLPSIDKEVDGGKLAAHKSFWGLNGNLAKHRTITELIYIPNEVEDGLYLLNLQTLNIHLDASPSRPVIYKLYLQ